MSNVKYVVAVDPGGTTGLAMYSPSEGMSATQGKPYEIIEWIGDSLDAIDIVYCERFTISQQTLKKSREGSNVAIETIGIIRWLCSRAGIRFVEQTPGEAKGFATNDKLRAMGWLKLPDHARDAARHLLLAVVKERLIDPKILLPQGTIPTKEGS